MSVPFFTKSDYLPNVVLDLDDFASNPGNSRECLRLLKEQKEKYPNFKVTLFAIPFYEGKDNSPFYRTIIDDCGDWIQLGIHGWHHKTPRECTEWTEEEAYKKIKMAENMGVFEKIFKAPGWQINRGTYKILNILNYIIADHTVSQYTEKDVLNKDRRPSELKAYTVEHPWIVHGHTWDMSNPDPRYRNGIRQIIEEHDPLWDENSKFWFITELFENSEETVDPVPA